MNLKLKMLAITVFLASANSNAYGGISIEPYVSISSNKAIKPEKAGSNKATETVKQRTTYGIRGSLSFWRLFKFQLGAGQNQLDSTAKTSTVVDEYDEIDYKKDLNMDTSDQNAEVKTSETQRKANAALVLDPSFWIFIARAKAGVQAQQRLMTLEQVGQAKQSYTGPITYKPNASVGLGVRLGSKMHAMAEYGFYFYKFPKTEPFEREVSVSYGVNF